MDVIYFSATFIPPHISDPCNYRIRCDPLIFFHIRDPIRMPISNKVVPYFYSYIIRSLIFGFTCAGIMDFNYLTIYTCSNRCTIIC